MAETFTTTKLDPDPEGRFVPLRRQLEVTSFGMNQIVLEPGARNRIHSHKHQEEVFIVLEGTLTLIVEGEPRELGPGELIRVAPNTRRQLINRHRHKAVLIALGGMVDHTHEGRDGEVFLDWESEAAGSPQETPAPENLADEELVD